MATENEEALNAALNTTTGQEPAPDPDPEPIEPDADPEGGDPDQDPDPEAGDDPDPEPEPKVSRAQARIQKLAEERAQEKAAREAAERERDFYRQQVLANRQPPPPEEELDADEKWRRDANARIHRTEAMAADMADKSEFLTKHAKNSEVLAMLPEVEARLAAARAQGSNAPRENVLKFLLGEKHLERMSKAPAVRQKAAERVNAARGQPLGTKSNVQPSKQAETTLAERLKDVPL